MPDVRNITVILRNPNGNPDDHGQVTHGHYILDGNKVRLTDSKGTPVRRSTGDPVVHGLKDGEDPELIARVLTREFRRHIHGGRMQGFSGPIRYPKSGWR